MKRKSKNSTKPETMGDLITMKEMAKFWRNRKYNLPEPNPQLHKTVLCAVAAFFNRLCTLMPFRKSRAVLTLQNEYSDADLDAFKAYWKRVTTGSAVVEPTLEEARSALLAGRPLPSPKRKTIKRSDLTAFFNASLKVASEPWPPQTTASPSPVPPVQPGQHPGLAL